LIRISPSITSLVLLAAAPCLALAPTRHTHSTAHATVRHAAAKSSSHKSERVVHHDPVVAMDTERATAIQSALIRQGYLTGEPTGAWDANSVAAMQKLQGENGWQTKITPDSRALIKLGLGPQPDSQPTN
jgi:hypothetical protein